MTLPKSNYEHGETLTTTVNVRNDSSKNVDKVKVRLVRVITCFRPFRVMTWKVVDSYFEGVRNQLIKNNHIFIYVVSLALSLSLLCLTFSVFVSSP